MESVATTFARLQGSYQFQTACYALYVYDHMLTFSDEVDRIWSERLSFPTLLFYINRYLTHIQFIILQVAFYETNWTPKVCHHFVKFGGATSLCIVTVIEIILILRVYALYLGNRRILYFLFPILGASVIIMILCVITGRRTPHPPGLPGCVLTGSNSFFAAFWAAPLVTDSFIFILTVWRTITYRKRQVRMTTIDIIFRDGLIYYAMIAIAKGMNTFIYLLATEDLKGVGTSFSRIIASIMISRLQLNLRSRSSHGGFMFQSNPHPTLTWKPSTDEQVNFDTFFTVGNLGEQLVGTFFDSSDGDDEGDESTCAGTADIAELKASSDVYYV